MVETFIPASSNIDSVAYDSDRREMTVEFKTGNSYLYRGVPKEVYLGLMHARSAGEYFYRHIRTAYPYSEV